MTPQDSNTVDDEHKAINETLREIEQFVQDPPVVQKEEETLKQAVPITPPSPRKGSFPFKSNDENDDTFNPSNKSTPKQPEEKIENEPKQDLSKEPSSPRRAPMIGSPDYKPRGTQFFECNSSVILII